jgi:hypothetical protein
MDLFLGSKMVDTAHSFHDEFWAWTASVSRVILYFSITHHEM